MIKHILFLVLFAVTTRITGQKILIDKIFTTKDYIEVNSIPLENGCFFYNVTEPDSKHQTIMLLDSLGKTIFEISNSEREEMKEKIFSFIYSSAENAFYGIRYSSKGYKNVSSNFDVIKVTKDGKIQTKQDIEGGKHIVSIFMLDNKFVVLSLDDENVPFMGQIPRPSGKFTATILESDFSKISKNELLLPAHKVEEGISKYKLMAVNEKDVFFVTEGRYLTNENLILIKYEFIRYDIINNKIVMSKELVLDLEKKCPRSTITPVVINGCNVSISYGYDADYPNMIYKEDEKAFYFLSSYGDKYNKMIIKNDHDGSYILKFNSNFELEYNRLVPANEQVKSDPFFKAYLSAHYMNILNINGKNYFVCETQYEREPKTTHFYEIDTETVYLKYSKFVAEPINGAILETFYSKEINTIFSTLGLKKGKSKYRWLKSGKREYVEIIDYRKKRVLLYSL